MCNVPVCRMPTHSINSDFIASTCFQFSNVYFDVVYIFRYHINRLAFPHGGLPAV